MCEKFYILRNEENVDKWSEDYKSFLRCLVENNSFLKSCWGNYRDPDSKKECPLFYKDICRFLEYQEKNIENLFIHLMKIMSHMVLLFVKKEKVSHSHFLSQINWDFRPHQYI